jgi:ATP-binding cassette subfamily B protein
VISVAFAVIGEDPSTTINDIFAGLPAANPTRDADRSSRPGRASQLADMLGSMRLTPGQGVDFADLANILLLLVGVYLVSSVFAWIQGWIMAGVTQRTVLRLR